MLKITRRISQTILIGSDIRLTVEDANGEKIKFSIDAPDGITVNREEVDQRSRVEDRHK